MRIKLIYLLVMFYGTNLSMKGQLTVDPDSSRYPFIQFEYNRLILPDSAFEKFRELQNKFSHMQATGTGTLHYLQIGDSHIQADYLSSRVRDNLALRLQCSLAGRGFVFPYKFAKTNNPENYRFSSNAHWEADRSVNRESPGDAGLAGVSVYTRDSLVHINLKLIEKSAPVVPFTEVTLLFESSIHKWRIEADGAKLDSIVNNGNNLQSISIHLPFPSDSLNLKFQKSSCTSESLSIHGLFLSNGHPGIIYSAAGSNGASVESALRCNNLVAELQLLKPDVLILSFGTNDAFYRPFDKSKFHQQYDSLMQSITSFFPDLPVILTTPGDAWAKNHKFNPCVPIVRDEIFHFAEKYHCAVWDLFTIMGGEESMSKWYQAGLSRKDRIHFSKEGYYLLGDLLTSALAGFYFLPLQPLCTK